MVCFRYPANQYEMTVLANKVSTPIYLLLLSGLIMVLTLWFSEKAQRVLKTSVDLSRQDVGKERFDANLLSQQLVRASMLINAGITKIIPKRVNESIEKRFAKPPSKSHRPKN
jgi:hypothetical protein